MARARSNSAPRSEKEIRRDLKRLEEQYSEHNRMARFEHTQADWIGGPRYAAWPHEEAAKRTWIAIKGAKEELARRQAADKRKRATSQRRDFKLARRNGHEFKVFHADHGITAEQMEHIQEELVSSMPQGFSIQKVKIPKSLGPVPNALYGPASGDGPVPESEVHYVDRAGRGWNDRMIDAPPRPVDYVQVIGIRDGDAFTLFTVYGGPLAPQNPADPGNQDPAGSRAWWSQHALSTQLWSKARSNSSKAAQKRKTTGRPHAGMEPFELSARIQGGWLDAEEGLVPANFALARDPVWRGLQKESEQRTKLRAARSKTQKKPRSIETDESFLDPETGDVERRKIRIVRLKASHLKRNERVFGIELRSPVPVTGVANVLSSRNGSWSFDVFFFNNSERPKDALPSYNSGFAFPSRDAAIARLKTYLLKVSGQKRAPRDVALPNMSRKTRPVGFDVASPPVGFDVGQSSRSRKKLARPNSAVLVNLTPHPLNLCDEAGNDLMVLPSSGNARVATLPGSPGSLAGCPVPVYGRARFGEVTGLPDPQPGVFFIVSGMVGSALAGSRSDVLVPGTSPADKPRRNAAGFVDGVTRLNQA